MNPFGFQIWVVMGAISGFLSVTLGAFGAHALKNSLTPEALAIYQTGNSYQVTHSLALILYGVWMTQLGPAGVMQAGQGASLVPIAMSIGILVFSGSLYALAITDIRWLGAITPIGGTAFLIGWIAWAWSAFRVYQSGQGS